MLQKIKGTVRNELLLEKNGTTRGIFQAYMIGQRSYVYDRTFRIVFLTSTIMNGYIFLKDKFLIRKESLYNSS
jgi:hypothetical protein